MKRVHVAYIPTLSIDEFAVAYEKSPEWLQRSSQITKSGESATLPSRRTRARRIQYDY
jgi:hypothetical protein